MSTRGRNAYAVRKVFRVRASKSNSHFRINERDLVYERCKVYSHLWGFVNSLKAIDNIGHF